tara:strand:+ start:241 stop:1008 length:768 start_codon:yes stop_codon:yes gene_type:complete
MFLFFIFSTVQGLTEFIPVSSSLHLIFVSDLLNGNIDLISTVSIHLGSILALVFFLYQNNLQDKSLNLTRLIKISFLGSLPIFLAGLLFYEYIKNDFSISNLAILSTIIFGICLIFTDKLPVNSKYKVSDITITKILFIGLFQCLSLIPGTSRAASVLIGSRLLKMNNKDSVIIALILSFPVILGAFSLTFFMEMFINKSINILITPKLVLSIVVSFICSYASILFFYKYSTRIGFKYFGYYRVFLGLILVFYYF